VGIFGVWELGSIVWRLGFWDLIYPCIEKKFDLSRNVPRARKQKPLNLRGTEKEYYTELLTSTTPDMSVSG
jgi:hypothetical protein